MRAWDFPAMPAFRPDKLQEVCRLSPPAQKLLKAAFEKLRAFRQAYDRVLKVARTIADLEGANDITALHAAEAVQYRSLDRKYWMTNSELPPFSQLSIFGKGQASFSLSYRSKIPLEVIRLYSGFLYKGPRKV